MCSYIHNHVSYTPLADLNIGHHDDKVEGNNTKQGSCHGDEVNDGPDQRCSLICLAK